MSIFFEIVGIVGVIILSFLIISQIMEYYIQIRPLKEFLSDIEDIVEEFRRKKRK